MKKSANLINQSPLTGIYGTRDGAQNRSVFIGTGTNSDLNSPAMFGSLSNRAALYNSQFSSSYQPQPATFFNKNRKNSPSEE